MINKRTCQKIGFTFVFARALTKQNMCFVWSLEASEAAINSIIEKLQANNPDIEIYIPKVLPFQQAEAHKNTPDFDTTLHFATKESINHSILMIWLKM